MPSEGGQTLMISPVPAFNDPLFCKDGNAFLPFSQCLLVVFSFVQLHYMYVP